MQIKPAPPKEILDALLKKSELTVQEAAQLLRVSPPTAFRLYSEGELRGWRLTAAKNSPIRIYTDSVVAYIQKVQGRVIINGQKK